MAVNTTQAKDLTRATTSSVNAGKAITIDISLTPSDSKAPHETKITGELKSEAESLIDLLKLIDSNKQLVLQGPNVTISADALECLAKMVKSLTILDITLEHPQINSLSKALIDNEKLMTLVLRNNKIDSGGLKVLCNALNKNKTLTHLDLSFNPLKSEQPLANLFPHPSLKTLILKKAALGGTISEFEIFKRLTGERCGVLEHLDVSGNDLWSNTRPAAAYMIRNNGVLKNLQLNDNPCLGMNLAGAGSMSFDIADALGINNKGKHGTSSRLQVLNLSDTGLANGSMSRPDSCFSAGERWQPLEHLGEALRLLSNNPNVPEGSHLREVDLSLNHIDEKGAKLLIDKLNPANIPPQGRHRLTKLRLLGPSVNADQENTYLKELGLAEIAPLDQKSQAELTKAIERVGAYMIYYFLARQGMPVQRPGSDTNPVDAALLALASGTDAASAAKPPLALSREAVAASAMVGAGVGKSASFDSLGDSKEDVEKGKMNQDAASASSGGVKWHQ